jgi:rod shape-determining protein MreD
VQISYTSSQEVQAHRFNAAVSIAVPLIAIFLQAYIPLYLHFFAILDLPLLVTIFFAVARRGPIGGLLTGSVIGLLQDSLTHQPIGLYGVAKTVIGYLASSIGVKLDVENPGSRFLMTWVFYVLHQLIYYVIARGLANQVLQLRWHHLAMAATVNAFCAIVLFAVLDHFKRN